MGSAKVHAFSRPRSLVSYVDVDSNHGPVDFRRRDKYETLGKVETLGRLKEMETVRVSYGEKSVRKGGRRVGQAISGSNGSDRELGEISEESWENEPEDSHEEVRKPEVLDKKRKCSDLSEDGLKNLSPKVLDDDCEPGQIRESSELDQEEEQLPTIESSRWAEIEDCQSPNLKRMKIGLNSLENVLTIPDGNGESDVGIFFDGEEEKLPNIAVSRWSNMEDSESPYSKKVDDSPKPRLGESSNPRVNDDLDARVKDSPNPRSRKSSSPNDSEGTKRLKSSSNSSGGKSLSGESQHSSACSDTDGSHRSVESCGRDEIGCSDDEQYPMDVDHDDGSESVDPSPSNSPASLSPLTLSRRIDMMQGCKSVDEFERLNKINEGTYGIVYRARNKKTGEIVALKKVKMEREREGFPISALREINVLLSLQHPSIVNVKEVVVGSSLDSIFMVMEYMEHDLKGFMEEMKHPFSISEVKCLMLQLLEGVSYLHNNWILHRDLKTSNLLFNNTGDLKICDLGLARQYGSPLKTYTHLVVTLWYRAPELLFGAKKYSTAVDMWSVGCIMAELIAKEPLFNGKSEIDQIDKIFKMLGTPTEKIWPDFVNLSGAKFKFVKQPYNKLREKFPAASFSGKPTLSDNGFDLLNRLLTYDPDKRITAEEALNHEWFKEVPLPKSKTFMPTLPSKNDQNRQSRRLLKSPDALGQQFGRAQQVIDIDSDKSASLHLKTSTSFGKTLSSSMDIVCMA